MDWHDGRSISFYYLCSQIFQEKRENTNTRILRGGKTGGCRHGGCYESMTFFIKKEIYEGEY